MKGDDLADRLLDFSVAIIELSARLPKTPPGRHIAGQIVEAGTSVGAHYEEARGAESIADFTPKLGIALKQSRETRYWLKVAHRGKILSGDFPAQLLVEADELCAILGQSILTAKERRK